MEKIKLEICCGSACYLLGASKLLKLEEEIPEKWRDQVEIIAIPCMALCESENLGGAPYVKINGKILARATVEAVLDELRALIEKGGLTR